MNRGIRSLRVNKQMSLKTVRYRGVSQLWLCLRVRALAQSAPVFRPGITDRRMAWIKLTAPGGKLIHINVEQITSVRSDTQIPGAQTQLDFASGKLPGVQENVDEVMQLISVTAAALANDECA